MNKIISIHQPAYIPWLGYFDKIAKSYIHVILDDVEYSKNDLFNRNEINTPQGRMWLTIPIIYKNKTAIKDIKINNSINWKKKHWKSIHSNYSRSPYFTEIEKELKEFYVKDYIYLTDITIEMNKKISAILKINVEFIKSSELNVLGTKDDRLINICKVLNSNAYLSGTGAIEFYTDKEKYSKNNIKLIVQKFEYPEYKQVWNEFIPNLSILDILFNLGTKEVIKIIEKSKFLQNE